MEPGKRRWSRVSGIGIGVALALLIWPGTRWMVVQQLHFGAPWGTSDRPEPPDRAVARHPHDCDIRMAAIERSPEGSVSAIAATRMRALRPEFPNEPALYATILRYAAWGDVRPDRVESVWLTDGDGATRRAGRLSTPQALAAFDEDAATGERLELNNAYFPAMRAVGLFAAHRDAEALEAIHRAAGCGQWEEYCQNALLGHWAIMEEEQGHLGALARLSAAAAVIYPEYAGLRDAARIAAYKAMELERAGRIEDGLAVRHDVLRLGRLMRIQARSAIGSLVGIAISQTAISRPGGAAPVHSDDAVAGRRQRLLEIEAYVQGTGHAADAQEYRSEAASGARCKELIGAGISAAPFGTPLVTLIVLWTLCLLSLSGICWMAFLWANAALLNVSKGNRAGRPMPGYLRWGTVVAGLSAICVAVGRILPDLALSTFGELAVGGAVVIAALAAGRTSAPWHRRLLGGFTMAAGAWIVGSGLGLNVRGIAMFVGSVSQFAGQDGLGSILTDGRWAAIAVAGLAAITPWVTLGLMGILSMVWRVPFSVGFSRGVRGVAVPVLCALVMLYAGFVVFTVRHEKVIDAGVTRTVEHEGRYLAELAGHAWPDSGER